MQPRLGLSIAALWALAAPALAAADAPRMLPSQDVQVTFRTLGRNAGHELVFSQAANTPRIRVEGAQIPGYAVIDRAQHRTMVVMPANRMTIDIAADRPTGQDFVLPDAQARFSRKAEATVAGTPCTVWEFDTGKAAGTACITAGGVLLRSVTRAGDGIEATKLAFLPQPAARFDAPAGFQRMTYPTGYAGAVQTPTSPATQATAAAPTPAPAPAPAIAAAPQGGTTLPGGITLPPGFHLPAGFKLPPGFQLPPGVKLPPGVSLPASP